MIYGAIVFPHNEHLDNRGCFVVGDWNEGLLKCPRFVYFRDFDEFIVEFLKKDLNFENYRFYYHDDRDFSRFFRNRVAKRVDLNPHPYFRKLKKYDLSAVTELLSSDQLQYKAKGDIMNALHLWDIGKKGKDDIVITCLGILCYGLLRRVGSEQ